ncbi:conserved oligomeric Golgi complex subunit 1 isoform X2 [Eurytemora carolleeae]|uniref:conserved oligomeric Golgi complex subunit 1 isoform X2 n=1 Tax=Eurytemora carolleeae TaxID=1294199 RepID=UPI000C78E869|nr:conserved oligomeric Golgi complex subunit 1 isoform X2 [Eurytemora carolleeae]|eukprot:XP_023323388.1 conserved oligomeric Golgi complex subunit 1-like isoform X2 [Eurytemora affinis]
MTQAINLLDLDPDQLLSVSGVEVVEGVARRLQREVDSKREELRVMVGERYRDLIEAADTIQNMKTSSTSIIDSVSEMQKSTLNLPKQSLIYTVPRNTESGPTGLNLPYLYVASSIKLLMIVPEKIWAAVETGNLLQGAELYLLAQHVNTGLLMDQGGGITPDRIKQWFPVVSRQYATINNFYNSIINSAKDQLMNLDLNKDQAVDALTALLLLKGASSSDIFDDFLELRRECLNQAKIRGRSESARSSICGFLRGIISTVDCVSSIFTGETRLKVVVNKLSSPDSEPSLALIDKTSLGAIGRYLPSPVLNFKPRLSKIYLDLQQKEIVNKMSSWLEGVEVEVREEVSSLLKDILNLQGVSGVRQGIWSLLQEYSPYKQWSTATQNVVGSSIDVWENLYRETVLVRVQVLISANIDKVLARLQADIKEKSANCDTEVNLGAYIWGEAGGDLSSLWTRAEGEASLTLKSRGWSSEVKAVSATFDTELAIIWSEVLAYNKVEETEKGPFDRFKDSGAVLNHFRTSLISGLKELVGHISSTRGEQEKKQTTLFLARVLQSLPVLVKTLTVSLQSPQGGKEEVQEFLVSSSTDLYAKWSTDVLEEFREELNSVKGEDVLNILPAWDTVKIQESGESGDVNSIIRVPGTPSLHLTSILFNLALKIHRAHPSAIPASVLLQVSRSVLEILVSYVECLLENKLAQNLALQLSFNLRFAETMLLSREYKFSPVK